jgi:hypothetical protein
MTGMEIYSDFYRGLLSNITARPISWEAQQRSGVIDENQLKLVKSIGTQNTQERIKIVTKVLL